MLPALDVMKEYLGLVFAFPDVVTIHRGAAAKVKECDKMKEEGRIDVSGLTRGKVGGANLRVEGCNWRAKQVRQLQGISFDVYYIHSTRVIYVL